MGTEHGSDEEEDELEWEEDDIFTVKALEVPGSASPSSKRTRDSTNQVQPAASSLHQEVTTSLGDQLDQKLVRVKLIGAACGERYAHAGVSTVDNGWSIEAYKFTMQDLIGKKLVSLEKRDGMEGYHIKRDSEGVVLSEGKVSGFIAQNGDARAFGALAEVADDSQVVQVMFGTVPIKEKIENVAEANLDEVKTLVTPRSDASM